MSDVVLVESPSFNPALAHSSFDNISLPISNLELAEVHTLFASSLGAALHFDSIALSAGSLGSALPLPFFFGVVRPFFFRGLPPVTSLFTGSGVGVRGRF